MREKIDAGVFGEYETRTLYSRFHGLKNKSKAKGVYFAWDKFSDFLQDVISLAPDDYKPSTYRMRFLLEEGAGYCKDTMVLSPISKDRSKMDKTPARTTIKRKKRLNSESFIAEFSILLLRQSSEEQPLDQLAELAINLSQ